MNAITEVVPVETDVLIIGGGLAGCMAAIKASEYGVKVAIAEKSNTLSSGCAGTGIDHVWGYIPPIHQQMGWTIDDLVEDHSQGVARGFINKELLYLVAGESYQRVLDLERFGVNFRYPDSTLPGNFRIVPQFHSVPTTFNFDGRDLKPVLTKEAKKRGVAIYQPRHDGRIDHHRRAGIRGTRRRHERREDLFFQGQGSGCVNGQGKQVVPQRHGRLGKPPRPRERNG